MGNTGAANRLRGYGRTFKRGQIWWIAYYFDGDEHRESTRSTDQAVARRLLKDRMKQIHSGRWVGRDEERLTVCDLLDALELSLANKGAKGLAQLKSHLKPVRAFFALDRAVSVRTDRVERFVSERKEAGRASATINRELEGLQQAFNLAVKQQRLSKAPYIQMLREDNARQGFFEHSEFEKFVRLLPEPLDDLARFAYLSGWRRGEIVPLKWGAVDRMAREVRLSTSKNGEGRVLPLDDELWSLIERRWAARTVEQEDKTTKISEYVFHRSGRPIVDFRKAWNTAIADAKVAPRLFHDLRRTAVRNMVRAGVPQSVAMSISGHKTTSMFQRYNVTSGNDRIEALQRTRAHLAALPKTDEGTVVQMPATSAR
ncbi:MAG: site-specific integrase [Fimbriimonadaceae bacterium]|nr:site-specific integrase [Fimbriimonadaceae bacterium]